MNLFSTQVQPVILTSQDISLKSSPKNLKYFFKPAIKMAVNFSNISLLLGVLTWGVLFLAGTTNAGCTRMNIYEREDGSGDVAPIRVLQPPHSPTCINLQPGTTWPRKARALRMTANINCISVHSSSDCTGRSQCVCQRSHRTITRWDRNLVPGGRALSFGNCDSTAEAGGTVQVFEDENFGGASETIQIPKAQCESLRNDENWKDKISSLKVTQGCVEYFKQAGCTGEKKVLFQQSLDFGDNANQAPSLDSSWNNQVKSFQSCEAPSPGPEPEVSV